MPGGHFGSVATTCGASSGHGSHKNRGLGMRGHRATKERYEDARWVGQEDQPPTPGTVMKMTPAKKSRAENRSVQTNPAGSTRWVKRNYGSFRVTPRLVEEVRKSFGVERKATPHR